MKYNSPAYYITFLTFIFLNIKTTYAQEEKVITFSKEMWHTALTMSINDSKDENIDNILLNIVDKQNKGFEINILGGVFLKENLSVGMRYSYLKRDLDVIYKNDENESRYQYARAKHSFTPFLRNYFPISKNNQFSFFNETDVSFGFGNTNSRHTKSANDITKTFSDEFNVSIGVKPGLAVILTKGFAFEISVDLLGLTYANSDVIKDGVRQGNSSDFKFDFDISLLSLDFGLAYYF